MFRNFNRVQKKIYWSFTGNLIYALSQWLIITVIARFGSNEDLGIYSLGLAITAPIVLFFSFQLRTILATDTKNEYDFSQYLGGRIIHLTLSFIIILPIAFLYSDNPKTFLVIVLMGAVKYVESLSEICMGYFQKEGRLDLIGKSQLYRGISSSIIMSGLYILTQNIIISCIGLFIVIFLRYKIYDLNTLKQFTNVSPFFGNSWLKIMVGTFPLGVSSLIGSLNINVPRYFLDYFGGVEEVGIFSALYYILIAGNMVLTPISLLAAPKIANAYKKDSLKAFIKINVQLSIIVTILFLGFYLIVLLKGELILTTLYGQNFSAFLFEFKIISFSLLFSFVTTFFALSTVAARAIKVQPIINCFVLLITIFASYLLIKEYNILGASYSLLISRFFQMICSLALFVMVAYKKNSKWNSKKIILS